MPRRQARRFRRQIVVTATTTVEVVGILSQVIMSSREMGDRKMEGVGCLVGCGWNKNGRQLPAPPAPSPE
ncbi:hypothetical protein HanPI659440_Chr06g0248241 [Helianthus annuus]|nr:hypothetical protein HanPI659440_Chr06g0248241 [Helianthus annuus]